MPGSNPEISREPSLQAGSLEQGLGFRGFRRIWGFRDLGFRDLGFRDLGFRV